MENSLKLIRDPNCTNCRLHKTADKICILGTGYNKADVMIIGETPQSWPDTLLESLLEDHGFDHENTFITHTVACTPPDNRSPKKAEFVACSDWVDYQIKKVRPKYVLLIGNIPCQAVLGIKGIKKLRGKPVEKDGIIYLPTYHPSFAMRDPRNLAPLEADLALFREIVDNGGLPEEEDLNLIEVLDRKTFRKMLRALKGTVSMDLETSCLYPWRFGVGGKGKPTHLYDAPVVTSIGFGTRKAQWTIPVEHYDTRPFTKRQIQRMVEQITAKLEDCRLVAHNGKFDALWMKVKYGVHWKIEFDTMLAHYLLDENSRHGLKYLSQIYFGAMDYDIDPTRANWKDLSYYHAKDLLYTRKLRFIFGKMLNKEGNVKDVFDEILMPCSDWFVHAEFNGVYIDQAKMDDAEKYLLGELAEAKEQLDEWGPEINWRSPKQIASLLFDKDRLGLDIVEKTAKGAASTSESVLKRIDHPVTEALLRFRGAAQQHSFFIEGWKPFLIDGRLHPSFKLHGAVTGRPSCQHPNLQQVPRDPRIRSLITAPKGWVFIEADLSQIEMRVAAELSGDPTLLNTFYQGQDVHWKTATREIGRSGAIPKLVIGTARKISGKKKLTYSQAIDIIQEAGHKVCISLDPKWKDHRKKAKAINFGYLFGMWWRKFMQYARDNYGVKVSEAEAQASREAYFELYPELNEWHKRQRNYARRHGYVTTLSGRKRRLPAAQDLNQNSPACKEAQRQAINSPVQGFASDWNLSGALQLTKEYGLDKVRSCGTIHDAVVFECRIECVEEVVTRFCEIMKRPEIMDKLQIKIRVPIEGEAAIGPWSKGIDLEEWLAA
jgi:uracil-DNA glycosylase family 4